ncbi:MAG: isochorismatase family protein [Corynebacterium sp.]|uniref:isochorismatase family protein n=1 Tax=Corynebacterium TaxID=1716 RepID=UPI002649C374|nr:isochorismatase family protein [Corynebacterium sp.]MDN5722784.1 isochorismatase family protein [Corynebacterium sp.]MDN6282316.1 isochorismatase family protein [Corynebacterium sp.]MDN6304913.1 isochorismatase family protein [Corynebacterium sp.]MDN6351763.1 isochorismatase family protein [Corynebacterium sp.]MDN6366729.1 isochorismatase family protein [Corynebacterium sp.]
MTMLPDRPNTALLMIDVQNLVVDGAHRRDEVVGNIAGLVQRARDAGTPVVWVRHHVPQLPAGAPEAEFVTELEELRSQAQEPVVVKQYRDAFEDTDLEDVLAGLGVGRLLVAGAETDACIRSTIHGGFVRGYDVTLVSDAHTAGDKTKYGAPPVEQVITHTNLYWGTQTAPGRTAAAVTAAEVEVSTEGHP